jgi:putative spermidine/putrescine transport system ATP-binding protein
MFFSLDRVSKAYSATVALDSVSFGVQRGEIVSIIGPSGAGKTTLLKIIAGIEAPDSGRVTFQSPPSRADPVILVFQDYILFPNMTVYENVAFGLRARRLRRPVIDERVRAFLNYFGIADKARSYPNQLSAGQQQRAAIARAMVVSPSVLLLDEPFANLDKSLKMETAEFIRRTQKEFGITTISVTHDLEEAFAMSDRMGVMLDGRLAQVGSVREIYSSPASYEVARFLGPVNVIPRRLFPVFGIDDVRSGSVFARAEATIIDPDPTGAGVVAEVRFVGLMILYRVRVDDLVLDVYSLTDSIEPGWRVSLKLRKYSPLEGDEDETHCVDSGAARLQHVFDGRGHR